MTQLFDPSPWNTAFSTNIPGLQIAWDSTSLGTLKECPRKYQYTMLQARAPRATSVHLIFGQIYHSALETYDHWKSRGATHEDAQREATRHALVASAGWASDDKYKNRETLLRTIVWYLEEFTPDVLETVQLANGKPAVELSFRFEIPAKAGDGTPFMLSGHMDRLVVFGGKTYVLDRKTTKMAFSQNYFDQFAPHNQFSLYAFASKILYSTPAEGIIVDAAQVAVGFSRFQRHISPRNDSQLSDWYHDTTYWLKAAEGYALDQYWPQNDKSCLGGTTEIKITRGAFKGKKITLERLYAMLHKGTRHYPNLTTYALADLGGYVGLNKVIDVLEQGVKQTFLLRTKDTEIQATGDHRFNTPSGWKRVDELLPGDKLYFWSARKDYVRKGHQYRKEISGLSYYSAGYLTWSRGVGRKTQREYVLVYEAAQNNMSLEAYVTCLRKDKEKSAKLWAVPKDMHIHHKDGDVTNNALDNLELLSAREHGKQHAHDMRKSTNRLTVTEVVSVTPYTMQMTYDLVMETPHHNFIANSLVAHNCGSYGGCPFRSVCSKAPEVRAIWLEADYEQKVWDPLVARGDI